MTWLLTPLHLSARSQASVDAAGSDSTIELLTDTGTVLSTIVLASPAGVVVTNRIQLQQADLAGDFVEFDGTPVAARWLSGDGALLATCTVSGPDGGGDIEITNSQGTGFLAAGGRVQLKSGLIG